MAGGYVRFVDTRMGCRDGRGVRRKGVGDWKATGLYLMNLDYYGFGFGFGYRIEAFLSRYQQQMDGYRS
jgi:hypothetical protein